MITGVGLRTQKGKWIRRPLIPPGDVRVWCDVCLCSLQVHDVKVLINNGFCQLVWFTKFTTSFLSIWWANQEQLQDPHNWGNPSEGKTSLLTSDDPCQGVDFGVLGSGSDPSNMSPEMGSLWLALVKTWV